MSSDHGLAFFDDHQALIARAQIIALGDFIDNPRHIILRNHLQCLRLCLLFFLAGKPVCGDDPIGGAGRSDL